MNSVLRTLTACRLALHALRRNALRSGLTTLGVLIGVAAVTIVVALGEGASRSIESRIDSLGQNALLLVPEDTARSGARGQVTPPLTEDDARALERDVPGLAAVAPVINSFQQIASSYSNSSSQVVGSRLSFFKVRGFKVARGSLWTPNAENLGEKVCVIGATLKTLLFGDEDAVGRSVRIGKHPFVVIGVLEAKGQGPFGQDQDDVVVMPLDTLRAKLVPTRPGAVHMILLSAAQREGSAQVERDTTAVLRQRHRLAEGAENDFRIRSQDDFRRTQEQILGVLSALLLSIAAVSLVVGGIGIMNIMLVNVTERTREIGIRMAIGARENDILSQFLAEAVVLALGGGIGGSLVAALAIRALGAALNWPMSVSPQALTIALGTSTIVGVLFGFLPARRAARSDPIHALRRE